MISFVTKTDSAIVVAAVRAVRRRCSESIIPSSISGSVGSEDESLRPEAGVVEG